MTCSLMERWANELGGPRMNTGLRSPRKGVRCTEISRCLFAVEMDLIASRKGLSSGFASRVLAACSTSPVEMTASLVVFRR